MGDWEGEQLVPADWVTRSTQAYVPKGDGSSYGYMWTVYPGIRHFSALGMGGQQIHVYPDKQLVVVMTSTLEDFAESSEINRMLRQYILPAVRSDLPLAINSTGEARTESSHAVRGKSHPRGAFATGNGKEHQREYLYI